MDEEQRRLLERQHYRIIGGHSGVKVCHWMRQKLLYARPCYKETFYGIESHRCLQMTPVIDGCTQNCLFCWRVKGFSNEFEGHDFDEPQTILEESIKAQKPLISGFKGDSRCDKRLWNEALEPNQVAISLSGEPTLYPYLGDFIRLCHKRGMTTFLVTNGTTPHILEKLDTLPTQLYVSVTAPNEGIMKKLCAPMIPNTWSLLNQTLELLPSLDTRRVIRHTLVEGWNIGYEKAYAKMDEMAEPMFIEPKGFVFVGGARHRMSMDNMPPHKNVREFGKKLGSILGFEVLMEREDSRVVLLGDDLKDCRIR
ncbi:MAG: 4-demethylwyosine synthase TYW1 [Methanomassiliicoccales archaeon]|nr:MAG: 4-demethylwyosine synthase TYW1 [Methanomassiliicoccales archaeon]